MSKAALILQQYKTMLQFIIRCVQTNPALDMCKSTVKLLQFYNIFILMRKVKMYIIHTDFVFQQEIINK